MSYCGLSGVYISDELLKIVCIDMITKGLSSQQTLNKWFFSTKSLGKRERQALAVMFSLFNSLFLLLRDLLRKC
ncbi:hypothetical protein [Segatella sp.]|jgi:hypothetical protein|uniref:Uncharacterized protein n=1 Tax=Segatella copri TaxID=165179 RepID=A0AA92V339_9BACT|nr:hypothetical protein DW064_15295 [Segatella copri]